VVCSQRIGKDVKRRQLVPILLELRFWYFNCAIWSWCWSHTRWFLFRRGLPHLWLSFFQICIWARRFKFIFRRWLILSYIVRTCYLRLWDLVGGWKAIVQQAGHCQVVLKAFSLSDLMLSNKRTIRVELVKARACVDKIKDSLLDLHPFWKSFIFHCQSSSFRCTYWSSLDWSSMCLKILFENRRLKRFSIWRLEAIRKLSHFVGDISMAR